MVGHVLHHEVVVVGVAQDRLHTVIGRHNHETLRLQGEDVVTVGGGEGDAVHGAARIDQLHGLLADAVAPGVVARAHEGVAHVEGLRGCHVRLACDLRVLVCPAVAVAGVPLLRVQACRQQRRTQQKKEKSREKASQRGGNVTVLYRKRGGGNRLIIILLLSL